MPFARTIRVNNQTRGVDQTRVACPFAHFAKGWGVARSAVLALAGTSLLHAQSAPCGITSITEQSQPVYPPIARAAHVEGPVILLATFEKDGTVSRVKVVGALPLLDQLMARVAADYVKGWRANSFSGPRECPVVVNFRIGAQSNDPKTTFSRIDLQHVQITAETFPPTTNYTEAAR